MTGALLSAALAVLLWPDRGGGRARLDVLGRERLLRRAGAPPSLPVAAAVVSALLAAVVSTPLVACLSALVAFAAGRFRASRLLAGRAEERLQALTGALGVLGAELRSGRSTDAATAASVAACADDDCGAALARALRAPGVTTPAAAGDDEFAAALRRISSGVLLSARTGCSLAAVTAAVEDDLRAGHRLRQELRTATAGPRASAVLLAALPALGLAMGSGVGADPWRVLTTTGTGQVLLVVGVALELLGLLWAERLVRRAVR